MTDALRRCSTVAADRGQPRAPARSAPREAATNSSRMLAAPRRPEYRARFIADGARLDRLLAEVLA